MKTVLRRLVRFGAVGVIAFVVDAGSLWVAVHRLGLGLYSGRAVSFVLAATVAWYLNRRFTFGDRGSAGLGHRQWALYLLASVTGAIANVGTYALLVASMAPFARAPTLAVAAGSVAGMLVNFNAYSRFVFRRTSAT
jgi:putative flippase GtrA